jgi:hypothetical protein
MVEPGQDLNAVAMMYSVRVDELMKLNGLARSPLFAVVTRLDIGGDDKLFLRAAEGAALAKEAAPRLRSCSARGCGPRAST